MYLERVSLTTTSLAICIAVLAMATDTSAHAQSTAEPEPTPATQPAPESETQPAPVGEPTPGEGSGHDRRIGHGVLVGRVTMPVPPEATAATPAPAEGAPVVDDPTRTKFTALPGVFYGPETSVGFGASAGAFFDIDRPATPGPRLWSRSWVLVAGAYTLNRQAIVAMFPYLVFREGRIVVDGEIDIRRFPNRHFGFGRGAGPGYQTYTKEAFSVASSVLVQVIPRLYVGASVAIGVSRFVDAGEPPLEQQIWLGNGDVSGENGARPIGAGFRAYYDGRDHSRMTRHGHYSELQHRSYLHGFGSTHQFHSLNVDLRGYVPIARDAVFAVQLQSIHKFGDVPYEALAFVGGPSGMRAYRLGRYVDEHHTFVRAELRFPIYWRVRGAVGSEFGFVYGPGSATRPQSPLWDVTAGLRFVIREADRLVARADLAYGVTGFAGVLYLNEAF
jgi:hypothetical protein